MSNPPIRGQDEPKREKKKRQRKKTEKKSISIRQACFCQKLNLIERTTYRVYIKMNSFTKIRKLNYTNVLADTVTV